MKVLDLKSKHRITEVVEIHMQAFNGFFLTFLGEGFLKQLYRGFMEHPDSGLLVAINDSGKLSGFLAYSEDLSGFYRFLLRRKIILFAWYACGAFIRQPKALLRLLRAFASPGEARRPEAYMDLSSICVLSSAKMSGVGSAMITYLKEITDFEKLSYIKLETDALDNDNANAFYLKNGFVLDHEYMTHEGRRMNEYRYYPQKGMEQGE